MLDLLFPDVADVSVIVDHPAWRGRRGDGRAVDHEATAR